MAKARLRVKRAERSLDRPNELLHRHRHVIVQN
jgi:hypothetical protein